MPLILKVEGRTDEVIWIREGDHFRCVHPYELVDGLDECPAVGWYQVVQVERNRLEVRAVPAPERQLTAEDLKKALLDGLRPFGLADLIQVDAQVVSDLAPDPKTGKLKRITSRIGRPSEVAGGATKTEQLPR